MVRSVRVRLCTLTFHGYARLRTLTPQHSACLCTLGLGDTEVDLLYSHAQVLCRKKIGVGGIFVYEHCVPKRHLRGFQVKKKNVHACARLDGEMAHTYTHLPPNTAHACARLTLVCAHASNHGSGQGVGGNPCIPHGKAGITVMGRSKASSDKMHAEAWGVQSEHTSRKLPPDQHQGTCPAENVDRRGTMNPRGLQTRLFVGSKNTSWCQSEQPI